MHDLAATEASRVSETSRDPDQCLVERIARGDADALEELYLRHQTSLFRYLVQLAGDQGLAEEVLQDTLVAVWQSAPRFAGRSSVLTWLIGIARRQMHNRLRRAAISRADEDELLEMPSTDPPPEDTALAHAERDELAAAIRRLAPIHREVLVLAFVNGLSYREMAEVLDVPEGTVKSRLSNAKRALRAILGSTEGVG